MVDYLGRFVLPAVFDGLPPEMTSPEAAAMLLAIALQESNATRRRQGGNGPARGFWQFETGGVRGVLNHPASKGHASVALAALCYPSTLDALSIRNAIEHNDVLAGVFARLLLWTLSGPLPSQTMPSVGWQQYVDGWRPGKPRPATWSLNYGRAWNLTTTLNPNRRIVI